MNPRSNPLRRTRMKPGRPSKRPIPKEVADAVIARAAGACEACRFTLGEIGHMHHRKLRSQGGQHTLENLLLVHTQCHDAIHSSKFSSIAYDLGLLVRAWLDPADIPVTPFGSTVWAEQ
jgi:5-methylcytosine-specific restriction endonuclease McrA